MAIAPLNRFLTIAVPVAPGEQEIYTTPVGVNSILLFASVANVGVGTFPTITLTHRRVSTTTRTLGNERNTRVVKNGEVPPQDALILIDGRLVLERTAVQRDAVIIEGTQSGVGTVANADYTESTGITTITSLDPHGFEVGEEITLSNILFECTGSSGITSNRFPAPQRSFEVIEVISPTEFVTDAGIVNGITHTFIPAEHRFIRSVPDSIDVTTGPGGPFTPTGATYDGETGELTLLIVNHGLSNGNEIQIIDEGLIFSCSQDNFKSKVGYPRPTDPASGQDLTVTVIDSDNISVNVGTSPTGGQLAPLQMEFICSILENSTT